MILGIIQTFTERLVKSMRLFESIQLKAFERHMANSAHDKS